LFIHLGDDVIVNTRDVIAILNRQLLSSSPIVSEFMENQKGEIIILSDGKAKSVVVTDHQIYLSSLAPNTLKKRALPLFSLD
jgi:hypothetical protein